MKTRFISLLSLIPFGLGLLLSGGCGRPPSGGGGPPQGDFPVNVVGAPVSVEPLLLTVDLVGDVGSPETVRITARSQGELLEMPVEEGTAVSKGQLIARLDPAKVEARLREARARLRLTEATLERSEALRATNNTSEQSLDEARAAAEQARATVGLLEEELRDLVSLAPMDGMLGERRVSVGQVVEPGGLLIDLYQMDPLEVSFEVPERYLASLREGMKVRVSVEARPGEVFEGEVTYLAPSLRVDTRTLPVKARLANAEGRLRPGMFAAVSLVLQEIPSALFVPESAIVQRGPATFVVARNADYRAEMRPVTLGRRERGRVHVVEGLGPNDLVVAEGLIKAWPGTLLSFTEDSRRYGLEPSPAPIPAAPEPALEN